MSPLTTSEVRAPKALDIQHDTEPARDHGPAKHIPHIGHALLFFSVAWLSLMVAQVVVVSAAHLHTEEAIRAHQALEMLGQAASYVVTLLVSWILFREIWQMPFARGLEWNWLAVKRWWYWIVALGAIVSGIAQLSLHFVSEPKNSPLDQILQTTHGAWMMTAFGVVLAPLTEEIAFRGFLLPALAIAYDWLMMDRTPAGLERWQRSSMHSGAGLIFGAVFSNIPFALLHAGQLQHAWGALGILYAVGLVLSAVRVRTNSVASSVLMHATYNLTVFIVLFVGTDGYRHMEKFLH